MLIRAVHHRALVDFLCIWMACAFCTDGVVDASYQSSAISDRSNTALNRFDSRFLVNPSVGHDAEIWSVSAYVTNLFDQDYVTRRGQAQAVPFRVGDPRTFGLIGQFDFD